jgi:hypothetical protein
VRIQGGHRLTAQAFNDGPSAEDAGVAVEKIGGRGWEHGCEQTVGPKTVADLRATGSVAGAQKNEPASGRLVCLGEKTTR